MKTTRIAVALAALAGCAEPSAGTFAGDYEAALCEWATGCSLFETRAQCRDALAWDSIGRFQYLEQAVAAERVRFDADAAAACVEAVERLACDQFQLESVLFFDGISAAPPVCGDVYVGLVRNYDPCLQSEECAGEDPVCGFSPTCTDACCVGACRDRAANLPAAGEPCTNRCQEGNFCAFDLNTGLPTVCTPLRAVGESCVDSSEACAAGLRCIFEDEGQAFCRERLGSGQACSGSWECAEGLTCYGAAGGVCRTLPGEGDACDLNTYPACARVDNHCRDSRCERLPGPGEACAAGYCVPYSECVYKEFDGASTCRRMAGLGEACGQVGGAESWVDCLGNLRCDGMSGRCEPPEPEPVCEVPG